jgi:hypothetical protein
VDLFRTTSPLIIGRKSSSGVLNHEEIACQNDNFDLWDRQVMLVDVETGAGNWLLHDADRFVSLIN